MNLLKKFTLLAMVFSSLTLVTAGNAIEDACEDVKDGAGAEDNDC